MSARVRSTSKNSQLVRSSSQQYKSLSTQSGLPVNPIPAAEEPATGLQRSQRSRRPSAHKLESDEYQASSRGSSRAPTPSQVKPNVASKKRSYGKRGDRPGRIVQPDTHTGAAADDGSPEPFTTAGSQPGNSFLASQGPLGNELEAIDKTEAIRRASEFLGVDASRLHPRTLQKVLAEISNNAKETQESPMDVEGGSAPAILQSSRRVVLAGRQQSYAPTTADAPKSLRDASVEATGEANAPQSGPSHLAVPTDEDTATESESESEIVELGPGDSVSQRAPRHFPVIIAPNAEPQTSVRGGTGDAIVGESDLSDSDVNSEDSPENPHPSKRLRLTAPHSSRSCCFPIGLAGSLSNSLLATHCYSHSATSSAKAVRAQTTHHSLARPIALSTPSEAPIASQPDVAAPSQTSSLLQPLPNSDLTGVLTWAARLAQQVTHPTPGTNPAIGASNGGPVTNTTHAALAKVLRDLCSHLEPTKSVGEVLGPRANMQQAQLYPGHTDLVEDNAEALEAQAARSFGTHIHSRRKASLADFPGLPRRIASLAIPELLAVAFTQGPYDTSGTLCDHASDCYDLVAQRELPNTPVRKAPHALQGVMVHRVSWFRGEVKLRVRAKIPFLYGFINPPRTADDLKFKRQLVKKLLPNTFHCRDLQTDVNQYEHPALEQCIAAGYFWGPDSIGLAFHKKFYPIPLPSVATILTTMQHCIKEWKSGRCVPVDLNANKQLKVYESHLKGLLEYSKPAPKRLRNFRREWFWFGVDNAGAPPEEEEPYQPITRADRVRPDTPLPNSNAEADADAEVHGGSTT